MLDRMSLLFRFQAITEAGSLRQAAERLNITQPALSRSLAQLEEAYGQPLLERHARGVRPTSFGKRLLANISRLTRDWELMELDLASGGRLAEGLLRISAGPLWSAVVLPAAISELHRQYPNLVVELGHGRADDLVLPALMEARIDVSFGGLQGAEQASDALVVQEFTTVWDRVIARHGHPIQTRPPHDYAALHDYPWIVYSNDPIYEAQTLHSIVERTGISPRIRVRSNSLLAIMRLLREGDYLCILPDAAIIGAMGNELGPAPVDLGRRLTRTGAIYRSAIAGYPPLQELLRICARFFDARSVPQC
jgi:DNA-binding transcriptional LysR family regulator